jgi:hypothetical protein
MTLPPIVRDEEVKRSGEHLQCVFKAAAKRPLRPLGRDLGACR